MSRTSYHHGNLAAALVDAGFALAAGGLGAVTVREAARQAGVTAPAAYRHFADRDHFLAEVARRCREALAGAMLEAAGRHRTPRHRFEATGRAYIDFARAHPGLLECAFAGGPSPQPDDPDPLTVLVDALDRLVGSGELPPDRRGGAEMVAWASVHGVAQLLTCSPLFAGGEEEAIEHVLHGVDRALGLTPARTRGRRAPRRSQ